MIFVINAYDLSRLVSISFRKCYTITNYINQVYTNSKCSVNDFSQSKYVIQFYRNENLPITMNTGIYIYIYMGISKKLCSNFDNLYFEKYCCKILNIYTTLWSQNKTGWGRLSIGRLLSQIGLRLEFLGYFGYFYHEMRSRARSFGDGEWCVSFLWHTYIQLEYYRRHAYILFDTTLLFTFHTLIQSYFEIRNTTSILLECYAW